MSPKIRPIIIGVSAVCIISVIFYIDFSTERVRISDFPEGSTEFPCLDNDKNVCAWNIDHPNSVPENLFEARMTSLDKLNIIKTVDVDREKIFKIMADVKNYPLILPTNIETIKIIEETNSTITAEETIYELGIRTTLLVKHTFVPYEKHTIEILDGDAKGTKIIANFTEIEDRTKITVDGNLKLDGILHPFTYIALGNINSAMETVISAFVDRALADETEAQKIVNQIYRETLFRLADDEALYHFSSKIENGDMTPDDLRQLIKDSDEFKYNLLPNEMINLNSLSTQSKETVNNLYQELYGRHADPTGLTYWGSMIEIGKMTEDDLRLTIMDSQEYAFNSNILVVDEVSVQNGIPIVLNWSTYNSGGVSPFLQEANSRFGVELGAEDTFNTLVTGYHIYRDHESFHELNFDEICTEDGFCSYEDYLVEADNSYFYQITPITTRGEIAQGCLDHRQVCFGMFEGTQHYPGFTGSTETQP